MCQHFKQLSAKFLVEVALATLELHVEAYIDFEADETSDVTPDVLIRLRKQG